MKYTVSQLAKKLDVTGDRIYDFIKSGFIKAEQSFYMGNKRYYITQEEYLRIQPFLNHKQTGDAIKKKYL